jgi:methyl-accepting chemotaxis protein
MGSLRARLILAFVFVSLLSAAVQGVWTTNRVRPETEKMARTDLILLADSTRDACQSVQELLESKLPGDARTAKSILSSEENTISVGPNINVEAQIRAEEFKPDLSPVTVSLASWTYAEEQVQGGTSLVDRIGQATGDACSLYQPSDKGLVRVATTVKKADGSGRDTGPVLCDSKRVADAVLAGTDCYGSDKIGGTLYAGLFHPVTDGSGKTIGVLYLAEAVGKLYEQIVATKIGTDGYIFVLDGAGNYVISKGGTSDGANMLNKQDFKKNYFIKAMCDPASQVRKERWSEYPWQNKDEKAVRPKVAALSSVDAWNWIIGASSYKEDFEEPVHAANMAGLWGAGIALVISLIVSFLVATVLARPFRRIATAMHEVSTGEGDLTRRLTPEGATEARSLATSFNEFAENIRAVVQVAQESSAASAETSDQVSCGANEAAGAIQQIAQAIDEVAKGAGEQTAQLAQAADGVREQGQIAEQLRASAEGLTGWVNESVTAVGAVVEAMQEISAIADIVGTAAQEALTAAETGQSVAQQTDAGMVRIQANAAEAMERVQGLVKQSETINEMVSVITDVAEQTNLLALNAAIEAARAGEHGRGFAVVADEVRKLAERTAQSSGEIAATVRQVRASIDEVVTLQQQGADAAENGVNLAHQSGEALAQIAAAAASAAEGVGGVIFASQGAGERGVAVQEGQQALVRSAAELTDLADRTLDIATAIGGMVDGVTSVAEETSAAAEEIVASVEEVAAAAREIADASVQSADAARELSGLVGRFHV